MPEPVVTSYTWAAELPEAWKQMPKVKCMPWTVAVEMAPAPESRDGIIIPDIVTERSKPDIGVVLFAGESVPLKPGTPVVVRPGDGKVVEDFYDCKNEVRLIGSYSRFIGESEVFPYDDSIIAYWDGEWKATGHNVIIELEEAASVSEGGILLSDGAKSRDDRGRVVSVGGSVIDIEAGDTVCFAKRALRKIGLEGEIYSINQAGIYFVEVR